MTKEKKLLEALDFQWENMETKDLLCFLRSIIKELGCRVIDEKAGSTFSIEVKNITNAQGLWPNKRRS